MYRSWPWFKCGLSLLLRFWSLQHRLTISSSTDRLNHHTRRWVDNHCRVSRFDPRHGFRAIPSKMRKLIWRRIKTVMWWLRFLTAQQSKIMFSLVWLNILDLILHKFYILILLQLSFGRYLNHKGSRVWSERISESKTFWKTKFKLENDWF